jgi:hypothetical protein
MCLTLRIFYITSVCTLHVSTNIGHLQVSKIVDEAAVFNLRTEAQKFRQ